MAEQQVESAPLTALLRQAVDEARELVGIEIELAKDEMKEEIRSAERAAIGFGVAAGAALVGLSLLAVAVVLALGGTPLAALLIGLAFLVVSGAAAALAYGALPKKPLGDTAKRVEKDVQKLKEHAA